MAKWVYSFKEGNADMRDLLGGKGANLAEMTNLGLPIPQGFTVTTEACTDYYNNGKQISDEVKDQILLRSPNWRSSRIRNSAIPRTRCLYLYVQVPGHLCRA